MPPRPQPRRQARPRGYDPTASISAAAQARRTPTESKSQGQEENQDKPEKRGNDELKRLIETLKSKMNSNRSGAVQKKIPPRPQAKATWNRSITKESTWSAQPAYTVLTRISNHEKVPAQLMKGQDLTVKAVPHSFLYRPGLDGIKIDKLNIKSGKQIGWG